MVNFKVICAHVRAALMRRGRTEHEADDLVQEAWVRMASRGGHDAVANPEAFMMRTAFNLSIDQHRVRSAHGVQVAIEDVVLAGTAPGAEALLLGRERLGRMSAGLERLPERTRDIFLAHRLDGRSYADIGRELGISSTAVEKHVSKATLLLTGWMEGW
jgi:RNA polymerase sigma factor (sigma-70 family)